MAATINPDVFKAYDVRGLYPQEITEHLFRQLGRALVAHLGPGRYAVTRDMRLSSPSLAAAFIEGAGARIGREEFRIRLTPGRYKVEASPGERSVGTAEVVAVEGQETPLEITLP